MILNLKYLVFISIIIYIIEIISGAYDSYHANSFFLYSERLIAFIFTLEIGYRLAREKTYTKNPLIVVDLISVIPFWVGFFVPVQYLHFIRSFRVLRLLKFFRYSRSLQIVALGFYRALPALKPLAFSMMIAGLFCTLSIFEVESVEQPDKFKTLLDSTYFTFVTVATIGYGDLTPVSTLGRIICMGTCLVSMSIFAGILGVIGNSFYKVIEEEIDPSIDPIEEFKIERMKHVDNTRVS